MNFAKKNFYRILKGEEPQQGEQYQQADSLSGISYDRGKIIFNS